MLKLKALLMRIPLWAVFLLLVFAGIYLLLHIPQDDAFPPGLDVPEPGKAVVETLREISKLVTTINSAMIAGAAGLAIKGKDWTSQWGRAETFLVMLVFLSGSVAYFGVYLCQVRLLTMLNMETINPLESGLIWSIRLQYLGVISGVTCLGLIFVLMLRGRFEVPRDGAAPAKGPAPEK
jgi:hypothetical protein